MSSSAFFCQQLLAYQRVSKAYVERNVPLGKKLFSLNVAGGKQLTCLFSLIVSKFGHGLYLFPMIIKVFSV